ncbi:hypothetical protein [Streptomyces rubellomurinus]|uniref:Uncharacterized protein n=1 Tax=Streptomyces sp. Y1 TaxID=3238634 RepID=A0AB39TC87_9ACTN|nr:hypothetical protein VM98_16535 [Streptomyces rubellomurinus subsp. indigoferus]
MSASFASPASPASPACPARGCGTPVDLLNDANAAGRTWSCPGCGSWGVAWSASYLASQPFEDPLVLLGRNLRYREPGSGPAPAR